MSDVIDCIVVGYNDSALSQLIDKTQPFAQVSGGFRHLLANSLESNGQRMRYQDFLNMCVERSTGRPSRLHVGQIANLGAVYLTNFLRKRGFQAELINFFNYDKEEFAELLRREVRTVAITTTYYFDPGPIQEVVKFVRSRNPDAKIIVGGPHIFNVCTDNAANPAYERDLLREMGADIYVFDSQGEQTLSAICAELRKPRGDLSGTPNVVHTKDGWKTVERGPRRVESNDMNANVIDWRDFSRDLVVPTVQTRTARSCAFKCAFCRYPVMAGHLDLVSLDVVERELDYFQEAGVRYVLFIDDTFNIPEPRFKDLCRRIIKKKYDFQWFSYFRCANADDESFELMARAGCKGVFLGIESGDQAVLKAMRKAATVEKYLNGIRKLNANGIVSYASFIVGHPGETRQSALNTFEFIERAHPTFFCLESFFFDPKTPIGAVAKDYDLQGNGYRWKHRGMDWKAAAELVEQGYREIRGSVVLPLYGFDLWTFAYLLGAGIEEAWLTRFLKMASEMMIDNMRGSASPVVASRRDRDVEALFSEMKIPGLVDRREPVEAVEIMEVA